MDVVGLLISAVGLVLTTQAAAENSASFVQSPSAVVSAAVVGALLGFVFGVGVVVALTYGWVFTLGNNMKSANMSFIMLGQAIGTVFLALVQLFTILNIYYIVVASVTAGLTLLFLFSSKIYLLI